MRRTWGGRWGVAQQVLKEQRQEVYVSGGEPQVCRTTRLRLQRVDQAGMWLPVAAGRGGVQGKDRCGTCEEAE